MTDARSKQPDKLEVDLKRLGTGDPFVAVIESWTYFGIKNEDVFPRELTVRFQAGGFPEAVAKARTLAETINVAHDIHKTNVRLVCEEARFDAMTKADKPRIPADFPAKKAPAAPVDLGFPFQDRVRDWVLACFGEVIAADVTERNHRFLEEALELVQAKGCTASEARQLVEYVFARPAGDPNQEVGGVLVTLAALCEPSGIDMVQAGEAELARVWTKVEAIRAKQAAKPKHSPLPAAIEEQSMRELIRQDLINTPETADFMAGLAIEATHQRERWGSDHDSGKTAWDWFWLIGYLAQKAATAAVEGDQDKACHHTISTAAALANWHCALTGTSLDMRPGIATPEGEAA